MCPVPFRPSGIVPLVAGALCAAVISSCGGESPTDPAPPLLSLSASEVALTGTAGDPVPSSAQVAVANGGGGTLSGLSASITYGAGQPSSWLDASLQATSAPTVLELAADLDGPEVGSYEASVSVSATGVSARTITVRLVVEMGAPPTIVVTSPARAAMLSQGTYDDSPVQITGEACHPTVPIASLEVGGQVVAVSGTNLCEPFDVVVSSPWGLSTITARATNAFGRSADLVQSYLRSPEFESADFPPAALDAAFVAQLTEPVFDDLDRGTLDDVATFIEAGLGQLDLSTLVPATLYSSTILGCDLLRVTTRGISMNAYDVAISVGTTALDLDVTGSGLVWGLRVSYTGCLGNVTSVNGLFLADAVTSSEAVDFVVSGSDLVPTATNQGTGIVRPRLDLSAGAFIQAVVDVIQNQVVPLAVNWITDEELAFIRERHAQTLAKFEVVRELQRQRARELRTKRRRPRSGVGTGQPTRPRYFPGSSGGRAGAQVTYAGMVEDLEPSTKASAFGSIARPAPPARPGLPDDVDAAYGVSLDLVNEMLWVAWQTGLFDDPDLAELLGRATPGLSVAMDALLPPVVRPGSDGAVLGVDWGDVSFSVEIDPSVFSLPGVDAGSPVTLDAFASVRLEVGIDYDAEADVLVITLPAVDARVQLVGSSQPLDEAAITEEMEALIVEALVSLTEDMAASIPTIGAMDLGDLPGLPPGLVLRFTDATVGIHDGYLTLSGNIR